MSTDEHAITEIRTELEKIKAILSAITLVLLETDYACADSEIYEALNLALRISANTSKATRILKKDDITGYLILDREHRIINPMPTYEEVKIKFEEDFPEEDFPSREEYEEEYPKAEDRHEREQVEEWTRRLEKDETHPGRRSI